VVLREDEAAAFCVADVCAGLAEEVTDEHADNAPTISAAATTYRGVITN
jgi:hypothetical protein